ncbi:MAG: AAA family ATPase [Bacteroidota bacterium]|nr:AAA family ATPase [Bacteroidota bacterium]
MSKIRIKNFGPIKEGCQEYDGWIDIKKVTVFIGNQGSGKSTVAKLISTFMWLEKALIRGDMKAPVSYQDFVELIEFHRLENYLQSNTEIEYEGTTFRLKLVSNSNKKIIEVTNLNGKSVKLPKIMYVPAERNFLSSIENINKVSDLIVGSLKNYSVEFRNAQLANKGKAVELPINNTKIVYDPKDDENYLEFNGKRLKLSHASSGFHSFVPLYWITKYLNDFVKQSEKVLMELLSTDQTVRRKNELKELNSLGLDEKTLRAREKKINEKFVCKYFINIVEEPEQNLFPTSQKQVLYSLLGFNNMIGENRLIMTTHSPYLLVYLTLCVEANRLKQKVNTDTLKSKLSEIVPLASTVDGNDLVVYQLNEINGIIAKLKKYKGLPSDENELNNELADANDEFSKLLDLEDLCQ